MSILDFTVDGKTYTHNDTAWEVRTNRHTTTGGEAWGWIAGPVKNLCWTGFEGHMHARRVVSAHNDWLEAQEPASMKLARLMPQLETLRRYACEYQKKLDSTLGKLDELQQQVDKLLQQVDRSVPS